MAAGRNSRHQTDICKRQRRKEQTGKALRWILVIWQAHLSVLEGLLGQVGGCILGVRLLDDIGSGVHGKADKAGHVEGLHNAVPAVAPEPLIIPWHVLASRDHEGFVALHQHNGAVMGT